MIYSDFLTQLSSFIQRKDVTKANLDFFVNTAKNELQLGQDFNFMKTTSPPLAYPAKYGTGVSLPLDFKAFDGDYAVKFQVPGGCEVPLKGTSTAEARRRKYQYTQQWGSEENLQWTGIVPAPNPPALVVAPTLNLNDIEYYLEWKNNLATLFIFPEALGASLIVQYKAWILDYINTDSQREDFLLDKAPHVLLWGALRVQNRFAKEEQRIPIDAQAAAQAMTTLFEYDAKLASQGDNMDLD